MRGISGLFFASVLVMGLVSPVYGACDKPLNPGDANKSGASGIQDVIGFIQRPCELEAIPSGAAGIAKVVGLIIEIIYAVAGLVFLFMMIFGAFQWMTSGGNKETLAGAQKRILHAIIGFVLLAFTFLIVSVIARITNFQIYQGP